jgi:hypothetical protein
LWPSVLMRIEGLGVGGSAEVSLRPCTLNLLGDRQTNKGTERGKMGVSIYCEVTRRTVQ